MEQADYVHLVRVSELASAENSHAYRRSVVLFAALGYAWVLGCLILALCLLVPGCLLVLPVITALSLCSCGCLPLLLVLYRLWILPGKVWCSHIAVIMFIRIHILLFVGVLFVHKSYPLS